MGVGAQGSTIAKKLDREPGVAEIICADYDMRAATDLEDTLSKARAVQVDAGDGQVLKRLAGEVDLIVNGLPPEFNMTVMDAALENGCHYQDMASGPVEGTAFVDTVKLQLGRNDEFRKAGITGLMNTGSAPGFANVVTREILDKLDECSSIEILVYDGIWSKKFIPFWWSPETAFGDMASRPVIFENGEFRLVEPFNDPTMENFRDLGIRKMVDHEHEEPVTMGLLSGHEAMKGVSTVRFRYGGPAVDLAEYFYKMGLLSTEPVDIKGTEVIPMDLVSKLTPPAPKYPGEIRAVIEEGMISEEGAFLVRVTGRKDGREVKHECYVDAPGLTEAYEKAGITHESYLTGQSAFIFSKMIVNDVLGERGVFPPEMLGPGERTFFLKEAAELGITVEEVVTTKW